eukprot:4307179-Amphidinium_carterae.1
MMPPSVELQYRALDDDSCPAVRDMWSPSKRQPRDCAGTPSVCSADRHQRSQSTFTSWESGAVPRTCAVPGNPETGFVRGGLQATSMQQCFGPEYPVEFD